jgi:hypothetical protein
VEQVLVVAQILAILAGMAYQDVHSVGFARQAVSALEERKAETLARIASFPVVLAMKGAMMSLPALSKNTRYSVVVARGAAMAEMTAPPAWLVGTLNPPAAATVLKMVAMVNSIA